MKLWDGNPGVKQWNYEMLTLGWNSETVEWNSHHFPVIMSLWWISSRHPLEKENRGGGETEEETVYVSAAKEVWIFNPLFG